MILVVFRVQQFLGFRARVWGLRFPRVCKFWVLGSGVFEGLEVRGNVGMFGFSI